MKPENNLPAWDHPTTEVAVMKVHTVNHSPRSATLADLYRVADQAGLSVTHKCAPDRTGQCTVTINVSEGADPAEVARGVLDAIKKQAGTATPDQGPTVHDEVRVSREQLAAVTDRLDIARREGNYWHEQLELQIDTRDHYIQKYTEVAGKLETIGRLVRIINEPDTGMIGYLNALKQIKKVLA